MDTLSFILSSVFSVDVILAVLAGSFIGMLIGSLPGMGAVLSMVLLLPVTFSMDPMPGILLLVSAYQAAEYGGSISAIVMGIPGTPAALVTVFDGAEMARQGRPGKALAYSLIASTIGGAFSGILLIVLAAPLVSFALLLGAPEYFLIALLGVLAIGGLSAKSMSKSFISVVLGLMAGTIGIDTITGVARFTFGRAELMQGLGLIALMAGMFGLTELYSLASKRDEDVKVKSFDRDGMRTHLTFREFRDVSRSIATGSVVGAGVGIIPGMGAGPSAWFSYSIAQKIAKTRAMFGKGSPDGIAAPESANNATVGGALIPLLALGIPGSPSIAIVMGVFIIKGLHPGPGLFETHADLVNGIIYGFLLTSIAMFLIGKLVTSGFARLLKVDPAYLIPLIVISICVGTYASRYTFFDLWVAFISGVVTAVFIKLDYNIAGFVLALILGPIAETSLRRALVLSDGSYSVFVTRPISLVLVILTVLTIVMLVVSTLRKRRRVRLSDSTAMVA